MIENKWVVRQVYIKEILGLYCEGEKKGLLDSIIILLKKKFKISTLPDKIVKEFEKAKVSQLRNVRDNIFDIESLEETLEYLNFLEK